MKKIFGILVLFILTMVVITACTQPQRQKQQPITMQIQYVEATIIPGKTTKTEVLKTLGHPDSFSEEGYGSEFVDEYDGKIYGGGSDLTYDYWERSPYEGAKIRYIQTDGTEFGIILHRGGSKSKGHFYFNRTGILERASFH